MIGVHGSPTKPLVNPVPLHVEVLAWFSPATPPADNRTVIARVRGLPGSWPVFYDVEAGAWFSTHDGCEVDGVETWAEQPSGTPPAIEAPAPAGTVVRLTRTAFGTSFSFTPAGRALGQGVYELQLVAANTTSRSKP